MSHLIGVKAPEFSVCGVTEQGEFETYNLDRFKGQNVVLFFYPLDFTFVCPLELVMLNGLVSEFKKENAVVLGVSIDSEHTHRAWREAPVEQGGVGALNFPLLSDVDRDIMTNYSVMNHHSPKVALRGTVIIDTEGLIRIHQINDLPIGRNPEEILRLVKAMNFHKEHGDVCPPKWEHGSKSLNPNKEGLLKYLAEEAV